MEKQANPKAAPPDMVERELEDLTDTLINSEGYDVVTARYRALAMLLDRAFLSGAVLEF